VCCVLCGVEMVVVLKHDMKKIPIIGWCMQLTLYIFLQVMVE
jgi:1-acyl-sn-glycerol-3-phosphate acyltransferase